MKEEQLNILELCKMCICADSRHLTTLKNGHFRSLFAVFDYWFSISGQSLDGGSLQCRCQLQVIIC